MKSRAFAARRIKKAEEAPTAAPVTPPVPMSEGGGMFSGLKTETLSAVVKVLSNTKELENDKAAQELIIDATEELNGRPQTMPEAPAAPAAPVAAPVASGRRIHRRADAMQDRQQTDAKRPLHERLTPDAVLDESGLLGQFRKLLYKMDGSYPRHQVLGLVDEVMGDKTAGKKKAVDAGFIIQDLEVEEGSTAEIPEVAEAHGKQEDKTGVTVPATEATDKFASLGVDRRKSGIGTFHQSAAEVKQAANDMTLGSALKKSQDLGEKLKSLYLDAKILTSVNDTRPVRDAVEAIYHAAKKFEDATKVFNKQNQQEEMEAVADKAALKDPKKSSKRAFAQDEYGAVLQGPELQKLINDVLDELGKSGELNTVSEEDLYDLVSDVVFEKLPKATSITSWMDAKDQVMQEISKAREQWENRTTGIEGTHPRLGSKKADESPFRKHAPECSYLKSGDAQKACDCQGFDRRFLEGGEFHPKKGAFGGLVLAAAQKTALQMHPMAPNERYGLQGTEDFTDGTSPYIGEIKISDWPEYNPGYNPDLGADASHSTGGATIVADQHGIALVGDEVEFQLEMEEAKFGKDAILDKAEELCAHPVSMQQLTQMGFIQIAG